MDRDSDRDWALLPAARRRTARPLPHSGLAMTAMLAGRWSSLSAHLGPRRLRPGQVGPAYHQRLPAAAAASTRALPNARSPNAQEFKFVKIRFGPGRVYMMPISDIAQTQRRLPATRVFFLRHKLKCEAVRVSSRARAPGNAISLAANLEAARPGMSESLKPLRYQSIPAGNKSSQQRLSAAKLGIRMHGRAHL